MGKEGQNEHVLAGCAYADSRRDSIQLEAAYKAFQDSTGKGGTGPSLQEKQNKATRNQIRRAQRLIREDLCDEDDISASQEHDTPGSHNIHTIGTMLVSVKRQSLPEHEKEGTDLLVVKPLSIGYKRQNERRKSSR